MLSYPKGITNETFIFLILAIRPIIDLQSLLAKKGHKKSDFKKSLFLYSKYEL